MDIITKSNFYDRTSDLWGEYESAHKSVFTYPIPKIRFSWDCWYIPERFLYHRTPANLFYSSDTFNNYRSFLEAWGLKELGIDRINTFWLSYYVDGCYQRLHVDSNQGPWAFVHILTPQKLAKFSGGETIFLSEKALSYWDNYLTQDDFKTSDLFIKIPPISNQLLVFDGRIPHAVSTIEGTRDPLSCRVAIHGWFNRPVLRVIGSSYTDDVVELLRLFINHTLPILFNRAIAKGTTIIAFKVSEYGHVISAEIRSSTLRISGFDVLDRQKVENRILDAVSQLKFDNIGERREIIFPIEALG